MNNDFREKLNISIRTHKKNNFGDNCFKTKKGKKSKKRTFKKYIFRIIFPLLFAVDRVKRFYAKSKNKKTLISCFNFLYDRLEDNYSRNLLIKVLAFRLLGHKKVQLPLNAEGKCLSEIQKIDESITDKKKYLQPPSSDVMLFLYDLPAYGFPVKIYLTSQSIYFCFVLRQYEYTKGDVRISPGDIVVDAGACYGDTALFFSELTGPDGFVYSFEFSRPNLDVLHKNLGLNPEHSKRIKIIEQPIWSKSGIEICEAETGSNNQIFVSGNQTNIRHTTVSLDDFFEKEQVSSIDYIKMDIEGAELDALKGSENILRKYRPKLAICVYHKITDCRDIPNYLQSLDVGYKFYFDHKSIDKGESVLFACASNLSDFQP